MQQKVDVVFNMDEDSYEDLMGRMMELQFIANDISGRVRTGMVRIAILIFSTFVSGLGIGIVIGAGIIR